MGDGASLHARWLQDVERAMGETKSRISDVFRQYDANGDGLLSQEEFAAGVQQFGTSLTEEETARLIRHVDADHNGKINYAEFTAGVHSKFRGPPLHSTTGTAAVSATATAASLSETSSAGICGDKSSGSDGVGNGPPPSVTVSVADLASTGLPAASLLSSAAPSSSSSFSSFLNANAVGTSTGVEQGQAQRPVTDVDERAGSGLSAVSSAAAESLAPAKLHRKLREEDTIEPPEFTNGGRASPLLASARKPETWLDWGMSKLKCAKQSISERLGKADRTVNEELEDQMAELFRTQRSYKDIIRLATAQAQHLAAMISAQKQLGALFAELSVRTPDLTEDFAQNHEIQRVLNRNGLALLSAFRSFIQNVTTLTDKTIEDTVNTWKKYQQARLEYDAERTALDALSQKANCPADKLQQQQERFGLVKTAFEDVGDILRLKLKLLSSNRTKVMQRQLELFHDATAAYFSGNHRALQETLARTHIQPLTESEAEMPEWLDKMHEVVAASVAPNL